MSDPLEILLVEDDDVDAEAVTIVLERSIEMKAKVTVVDKLAKAVATIHSSSFDVIILDLGLPDSFGLDGVRRLRAIAPATPIVVLTGHDDPEAAIDAIRAGAQEFLSKHHMMGHLLTRTVRHSMARQEQLGEAQKMALTDPLTKLGNRLAFDRQLVQLEAEFRRRQTPFSIVLFDLDHFKEINDRFGHDAGDRVLQGFANLLIRQTRETDHAIRYGGEEFSLLMPHTTATAAYRVGQMINEATKTRFHCDPHVTVSFGVAEIRAGESTNQLVRRADQALYLAKASGRDCGRICEGDAKSDAIHPDLLL